MGYYVRPMGDYYRRKGDPAGIVPFMPGVGDLKALFDVARGAGKVLTTPASKIPIVGPALSAASKALTGGKKRRRLNPLNPRALRRALARAKGFERFARKTMHFTHRRPGQTRFKFPRRRKR